MPRGRVPRNTLQALRKVPGSLLQGRHVGNPGYSFTRAGAFVIGKEERLVLANWTSQGETELVANVLWRRFIAGSEEVARVEGGVAMKLVKSTV